MIETSREDVGWVLHEAGPENADHRVLLLPGALASWAFYEDLLAEPSIREAPIRFIATTLPGFGGTAPPDDLSMENYSKLASRLAADLSCDVVVGHSLGANVAIEIVSAREFSGPVVLLSPSFSRQDESKFPRALDRLSGVFGHLPYSGGRPRRNENTQRSHAPPGWPRPRRVAPNLLDAAQHAFLPLVGMRTSVRDRPRLGLHALPPRPRSRQRHRGALGGV